MKKITITDITIDPTIQFIASEYPSAGFYHNTSNGDVLFADTRDEVVSYITKYQTVALLDNDTKDEEGKISESFTLSLTETIIKNMK